ncbi:MAG TPA: GlsB/YeaQ/YmgE family stress response membrane protein [Anaerolineales bacterium]|nr:GlsB/YeaQ/YmgE family stress response membrane protein [Anaerolineales bacterium]
MSILSWIVVGLIAGWLAGVVMKGGGFGLIGDIIIGVIGGVLGGFIASYFFDIGDPMSGINLTSILIAFIGAVLLLLILRVLGGRRGSRR